MDLSHRVQAVTSKRNGISTCIFWLTETWTMYCVQWRPRCISCWRMCLSSHEASHVSLQTPHPISHLTHSGPVFLTRLIARADSFIGYHGYSLGQSRLTDWLHFSWLWANDKYSQKWSMCVWVKTVEKGWVGEGEGLDGIHLCKPSPISMPSNHRMLTTHLLGWSLVISNKMSHKHATWIKWTNTRDKEMLSAGSVHGSLERMPESTTCQAFISHWDTAHQLISHWDTAHLPQRQKKIGGKVYYGMKFDVNGP